ncbi:ABC transporter permease [Teredinibacter waterburyi]|uniref:ABC transporter permease n=1 Tax=Teredinibacter waterburyi TaxID=1500538 RepID=UPI00165FFF7A|nr:ABC transporter permease [Teredinibacter waterburyi]
MHLIDSDVWREIFESLRRHKLRTALTAFGVFWGIFMLVCLMGAGRGLLNSAEAGFGGLRNAVYVWGGRPTSIPYEGLSKGRYVRLNDTDIDALLLRVPGIEAIGPGNGMGTQYAVYRDKGDSFDVTGILPVELYAKGYVLHAGRFLNELDVSEHRKTAVIGSKVSETLFGTSQESIGKSFSILGIQFLVVGVISPSATSNWAQQDLSKIFLPHTTLRKTFNQRDTVHRMLITAKEGVDTSILENKIGSFLRARHRVHPDDRGVIGSYNVQKDYNQVQQMFAAISIFSWVVAIGTIIAGVVGVGNIMLISVKERTKEIGIRKAIGATPFSIVTAIIQESMVITFFAGYLGLVAGVGVVELMAKITGDAKSGIGGFLNPEVSFSTALSAMLVLLIAGAFASYLPARKAAAVDPVLALQDE